MAGSRGSGPINHSYAEPEVDSVLYSDRDADARDAGGDQDPVAFLVAQTEARADPYLRYP